MRGWSLHKILNQSGRVAELAFDLQRDRLTKESDEGLTCASLDVAISAEVRLRIDVVLRRDNIELLLAPTQFFPGEPPRRRAMFNGADQPRFHRVVITADFRAPAPAVRATFDGLPALELPVGTDAALPDFNDVALQLGLIREETPFLWRIRMDDVTLDVR